MVDVVGRGEDFGFIDVVNADSFEDLANCNNPSAGCGDISSQGLLPPHLALDEMANTGLGHDGDGNGTHDLLDHTGVGHASHATVRSDIGGHPLERHDGGGTGFLSNAGLFLNRLDVERR